jgi:hypothetical protein
MAPERSKKKFTTKIAAFKQVVNTVTSYEALIAKKLEQLPVPDMADSIWATVAAQLDIPPADGGGQGPAQPGHGLPGMGKGIFFGVVTAIVVMAIWLYAGKKPGAKQNKPAPQTLPAAVSTDTAAIMMPTVVPVQEQLQPVPSPPVKKDTTAAFDTAGSLTMPVDLPVGTYKSAVIPDSALVKGNTVKLMLDSANTVPPPKKPKGVKGIGDNDYKIISIKKDSVKKEE